MTRLSTTLLILIAIVSHSLSASEKKLPPPAAGKVDFEQQILPLLQSKCFDCHGPDTQESQLRLDRKVSLLRGGNSGEPAILVGNSADSHLVKLVAGLEAELVMPPDEESRLTETEIGLLRAWIDAGAEWPGPAGEVKAVKIETDHWSFQPLSKVSPPNLNDPWIRNEIDAFILKSQQQRGLIHSADAPRNVLLRRLSFDLLGLPPTPDAVQEFESSDDPLAYEREVERLLASPHFGERWARYWLDLVRFAETYGFETNRERPNAWPYRDYVIRSLNEDKPYDQFIREQIAGDVFGTPIGTAYLVAGPYDQVKSPDINLTLMQRQNELDDIINTTSTAFLGLTLGCARCHNHKFDPITQRDYYSWQAVFAGVQHGDRSLPIEEEQRKQLADVRSEIVQLERELAPFLVRTSAGRYQLIDDDPERSAGRVEFLRPIAGHGTNPAGTQRGFKDDPGDTTRSANLSGGRYTWWKSEPNVPVCIWRPRLTGQYRLWLSWGCGWETHTRDARYVVDRDGDWATTGDREEIAVVDQQKFFDASGDLPKQSLWSGFLGTDPRNWDSDDALLLVCGDTGTAITADAMLFEQVDAESSIPSAQPHFREPVDAKHNVERISPIKAKFIRFKVLQTNSGEPCIDELEVFSGNDNVALASSGAKPTASSSLPGYEIHKLEHINDGKYGNGHSWISRESGAGWVQIELAEPQTIDRIEWARDREGKFGDRLATQYVIEVSLDGEEWAVVAGSSDRLPTDSMIRIAPTYRFDEESLGQGQQWLHELQRLQALEKRLSAAPVVYAGTFSQPGPTHRLYRGEPLAKREQVAPDALEVIGSLNLAMDAPETIRRRELADWIASNDNPLTARVIVNRLWQFHFGRGLVDTPSDFGAGGLPPSHPELLDWLAGELIRHDWSLKHIHRLILNSSTYRQSNEPNAENSAIDSANVDCWRFMPRRLEAEPMRDNMLAVAGLLDLKMHGPGFSAFEVELENVRHYHPKTSYGPEDWRRMIYMTKVRMEQDATFGSFDCPDAAQPVPKRTQSTTPLQALNLFNSTFVLQVSERFADRLKDDHPSDLSAQITLAYELCYSRKPEPGELQSAVEFAQSIDLAAFCRALLNSNEFLFLQ